MTLYYDLQTIITDNYIRSYDTRYNMNPFICVLITKEILIIIITSAASSPARSSSGSITPFFCAEGALKQRWLAITEIKFRTGRRSNRCTL